KPAVSSVMKHPTPETIESADVIFLALPHTQSAAYMPNAVKKAPLVVDLSADYRFSSYKLYEEIYGVKHTDPERVLDTPYGLPEINREDVKGASVIANPGCYATATILALYPLVDAGLIDGRVFVDAKSGISGAGKKLGDAYLFINCNENLTPYNVNKHRHMGEIVEFLKTTTGSFWDKLVFCPQLLPLYRGMMICAYTDLSKKMSDGDVRAIYEKYYSGEPFIDIKAPGVYPQISDVAGTNNCSIGIELSSDGESVTVMCAIDNLVKGASGQAVQNMNIALGLDETQGLV
ncbi:MAG: N-acetyl-gamma-glutamyl-phosphate reductase, partial [Elusimicrobia bacterium]|nr:N-acetyl-gamma-glutamyl-phosphate reductase [Elusimicrobiota bacterium]